MKKLLFFDVDGTLLDGIDSSMSLSTINALKQVKANGHLIFVNTGRPDSMLSKAIKCDLFDGYVCGLGTHIIYHNETLFYKGVESELAEVTYTNALKCNIEPIFEGRDYIATLKYPTLEGVKYLKDYYSSEGFPLVFLPVKNLSFDKFCIMFDEKSDVSKYIELTKNDFDYVKRSNTFGELSPKGFDKVSGIKFLMDKFNTIIDDVYVFGDSANDLTMLKFAKHSIGMGNGEECIFEYCEFKTKKVSEDGIKFALEHYKLI